jgi:hypothetical protein
MQSCVQELNSYNKISYLLIILPYLKFFRLPFIFLLNGEKRVHLRKLPQTLETFI